MQGRTADKKPAGASLLSGDEAHRFEQHVVATSADDIMTFPEVCHNCDTAGMLKVVPCRIPHFKEVIIMAFTCDNCGWRTNEIKAGGAISAKGRRITLRAESAEDLARDFLKAETAGIELPELGVKITEGSLGGRFTTVEGIMRALRDQLASIGQFRLGDSTEDFNKDTYREFLEKLEACADGKVLPFTVIVDDPLANSYIQNIYAPDPDPQLTIEEYDRTWEQNEEFGLNDMKVDDYEVQEQPAA